MSYPLALTLPTGRPARLLAVALLGLIVAVELAVSTLTGAAASTASMANAIVLDLTVGGTLVVWYFGVRRGGLPWVVLLPTFLAGLGLSHVMVGAQEPLALDLLEGGAVVAEITGVSLLVRGVARGTRALGREAGDPLVAIRGPVQARLGTGVVGRLAASEVGAVWFATAAWRYPVPGYGGARRFGYGRGAGGIHAALLVGSAVEIVALHLLVSRWSHGSAWVLTGLALYGTLWVLADLRAMRLRPVTLDQDTLIIRTGLRWTMEIPRDRIIGAGRRDWRHRFGTDEGDLNLAVVGEPDVVLYLDRPIEAIGPFGITRAGRRIGFSADNPDALIRALRPTG